jgi:hypothetical protein
MLFQPMNGVSKSGVLLVVAAAAAPPAASQLRAPYPARPLLSEPAAADRRGIGFGWLLQNAFCFEGLAAVYY